MLTYITAFIFYTLAMIGILLIGFIVYKKTFITNKSDHRGVIKIVDSLNIAPKKMLFVVKIRNEKFLIASGAEHTTFLAKLEQDFEKKEKNPVYDETNLSDTPKERLSEIQNQFKDLYSQNPKKALSNGLNKKRVMQNLLSNLNDMKLK